MNVQVLICTYGDWSWKRLAKERAFPSAEGQGANVTAVHGGRTLAESRNFAVEVVDPQEWICFLDADDQLMLGYFDVMADMDPQPNHLLAPCIQYMFNGEAQPVLDLSDRDIAVVNPCCIGTLIHRSKFDDAGGFWEERGYEDWSMFRRAWLTGAQVRFAKRAVYRAHFDPYGRNTTIVDPEGCCADIVASHSVWYANRQNEESRT